MTSERVLTGPMPLIMRLRVGLSTTSAISGLDSRLRHLKM